jgi:uroporphyrinogen III methyltransferase/synthase
MAISKKGKVYLVGAGPGDPGLLTLRAKKCLSQADVVIYDNLANCVFLRYADVDAERIYVGKKGGNHTLSQEKINSLIVERAQQGRCVVRLKGGDPFIFGRGGEEALELAKAGLSFEVVPGITSAIAVPAYAGIPLTHRSYTSTVAFITGHEDPHKEETDIAWDKLTTGIGTLVFLMGVGNLPRIAETLLEHGRSPDTPVAVIRSGTLTEQKTLVGTLRNIARLAEDNDLKPPAVIVVGGVVNLRNQLNWFENTPLFGKRIVVTRAREQASGFLESLVTLGADCIEFPTIEIVPPERWNALDRAIQNIETYNWLLFTSPNGVKYFLNRLAAVRKDVRDLKGVRIGAIGPKTAERWHELGIRLDLMPDEYRAEAIVEALKVWQIKGARILLPRAAQARETLPEELRKMGAHVDVVSAYQTVKPEYDTEKVRKMLKNGTIHMVTFTSSSTVLNFVDMFDVDHDRLVEWMRAVAVACIGPITAKTAQMKGFKVDLIAPEYTIDSLRESILDYFVSAPERRVPNPSHA